MRTYKCYWATEIGEARLLDDVVPMITAKAFRRRRKRKAGKRDKGLASRQCASDEQANIA